MAMSALSVTVKAPFGGTEYNITLGTEDKATLVKQFLLAQGPLAQPLTAFSLVHQKKPVDLDAPLSEFCDSRSVEVGKLELEIKMERQTLADVQFQIDQLREIFGLDSSETTYVNGGATHIHEIKRGSKNSRKMKEDELAALAELPSSEPPQIGGLGLSEGKDRTESLIVAYPNPNIPKPSAVEIKLSKWQPLCRTPQFKLKGVIAFVEFIAKNGSEFHFVATTQGFIYVPQLTTSSYAEPPTNAQVVPSLIQAIEKSNSSTINTARKNWEKIKSDSLICLPIPQVNGTAPWLVGGEDLKISPALIPSLELREKTDVRDWNEDFQAAREVQADSFAEKIGRDRSLVAIASEFASAALDGAIKIVEGNIQALNPDEAVESAKLYLHRGIFYTHGSDFVNAYAGIESGAGARKAVKKGILGAEQLMAFDQPELCPVLTAVVEYCGRCLVAQAPVPGIFREIPLIVYGQSEDPDLVHFDKQVDDILAPFVASSHLKKHPVNQEGLELQTSSEVHAARSTDGRIYLIDLHRLQVPDLLSNNNELNLIRFEAIVAYFSKNKDAEKLNPDVWMSAENLPTDYDFSADIQSVTNLATFVRKTLIVDFVNQIVDGVGADPIDGVQLTTLLHRKGINMRLLGDVWSVASVKNLSNLTSVTLEEAIARSLKFALVNKLEAVVGIEYMSSVVQNFVEGFRTQSEEVVVQIMDRLENHFGFKDLPSSWTENLRRPSLLRLVSLKCGLQWNANFDLVAINPVIKYSFPPSSAATEALEAARLSLEAVAQKSKNESDGHHEGEMKVEDDKNADVSNGKGTDYSRSIELEEPLTILTQAVGIFSQVYGSAHAEVAHVLNQAATLFCEHSSDINKAIEFGRRAITIAERVNGLDSYDVIVMYNNLAYFEKVAGHLGTSLMLSQRVLRFYNQISWPGFVDYSNLLSTVGTTLLQTGKSKLQESALIWLAESIERAKLTPGGATGVTWFQYAQAQIFQHDYENASRSMETSYKIFKAKNGADDENTKDVKRFLEQLLKATISKANSSKFKAVAPNASPSTSTPASSKVKNKRRNKKKQNNSPLTTQ